MLELLIDNIFVIFDRLVYQPTIGLLTDLRLTLYTGFSREANKRFMFR